jgi:hypothetical protein
MTKPHKTEQNATNQTGTAKTVQGLLAKVVEVFENADAASVYRDLADTVLHVKAMQGALVEHCATCKGHGKRAPASPETRDALVSMYHATMTIFDRNLQTSVKQLVGVALSQGPGRELEARTAQICIDAIHIADVASTMLVIIHDKKPDDDVFVNVSANLMRLHRFLAANAKPKPTTKPTAN